MFGYVYPTHGFNAVGHNLYQPFPRYYPQVRIQQNNASFQQDVNKASLLLTVISNGVSGNDEIYTVFNPFIPFGTYSNNLTKEHITSTLANQGLLDNYGSDSIIAVTFETVLNTRNNFKLSYQHRDFWHRIIIYDVYPDTDIFFVLRDIIKLLYTGNNIDRLNKFIYELHGYILTDTIDESWFESFTSFAKLFRSEQEIEQITSLFKLYRIINVTNPQQIERKTESLCAITREIPQKYYLCEGTIEHVHDADAYDEFVKQSHKIQCLHCITKTVDRTKVFTQ